MVWSLGTLSVEFRDIPLRHCFPCYSLYLNTLNRPSTQKSNTNLNNLFYMNIKSDKIVNEIDNGLPKEECNLTMSEKMC